MEVRGDWLRQSSTGRERTSERGVAESIPRPPSRWHRVTGRQHFTAWLGVAAITLAAVITAAATPAARTGPHQSG